MIAWYLLISGIFLFFIPFFNKIKIGKVLELERELNDTKEKLSDFKQNVQQSLTLLNTSVTTLSTINNQIQINIPGIGDIKSAIENLSNKSNENIEESLKETKDELILDNEGNILALTKARVQIEYLLKNILQNKYKLMQSDKDIRYLTLLQLIKEFIDEFPEYRYLEKSLHYSRKIGNAAAHAQRIPEGQSYEAIELNSRLISTLKYISEIQKP